MSLEARIRASVRGLNTFLFGDGLEEGQLMVNPRGDLLVAQALPEYADLVAKGGSFHILSAATAALTAVPTTVAGHSLWNGEPDTGLCYVIDSFGTVEIVTDATQQNSLALFAMVNKGRVAAVTDGGLARGSMLGKKYGGTALQAAGATVVNDVWTPHGPASPAGTQFAGDVWRVTEYPAKGLYVIPPGRQFNVACAKTVATASQIQYFIRWHEVYMRWAA